jgi:hypothetical protein
MGDFLLSARQSFRSRLIVVLVRDGKLVPFDVLVRHTLTLLVYDEQD